MDDAVKDGPVTPNAGDDQRLGPVGYLAVRIIQLDTMVL